MTSETVAEDNPRWAASSFRLIEGVATGALVLALFSLVRTMRILSRSLAQRRAGEQGRRGGQVEKVVADIRM